MLEILPDILMQFARGGGGGSGGGSGGEIIALLGYVPSYYIGKIVKKFLPRKAELIVSVLSAIVTSAVLLYLAYYLHGGYFFMILIVIGIWTGWYAAFFGAWEKIKGKVKKAKKSLDTAAKSDAIWNADSIKQHATLTFNRYQNDWSDIDLESMKSYMTVDMHNHTHHLLYALQQMHRENKLSDITLLGIEIIDIQDDSDNTKDTFQVAIQGKMHDELIDVRTDKRLFADDRPFIEYWTFVRNDQSWLLSRIDQSTADVFKMSSAIKLFAESRKLHYSIDMGWLLLPNSGVLFKTGKFGVSDINNHTIGLYNQHLVQLYTYSQTKEFVKVVAQINLPKSYDGILVKPRTNFFTNTSYDPKPIGYTKYTFEWQDFNKRYEVYATNADRLAAFELVNPGFMQYLYDTDPKVWIEVADNVIYIHKPSALGLNPETALKEYTTMFTILEKAFKELKL